MSAADLERQSQQSPSSEKDVIKKDIIVDADRSSPESPEKKGSFQYYNKLRPLILIGMAVLILGWWISATILPATRHRWIVQTVFAWVSMDFSSSNRTSFSLVWLQFFILLIFFQFVPSRVFWNPIVKIYDPLVAQPFFRLPYHVRLAMGWACLLGIIFGSAFGFPLPDASYLSVLVYSLMTNCMYRTTALTLVTVRSLSWASSYSSSASGHLRSTGVAFPGLSSIYIVH